MKTFKTMICATLLAAGSMSASALTLAELDHIYIIGNAAPSDWVNTCAYELTHEGTTFVYEGGLVPGEFKFLTKLGDWTPAVMPFEGGMQVGTAGVASCDIYVTETGDPDNKWNITDAGNYRLTIDTAAETLKAEYLGEMPQCIYALGSSTSRGDSNSGLFMSRQADGKYVWQGIMTYSDEDKLIKFTLERGEWNAVTFLVPESVDHNDNVKLVADGGTYQAQRSAETEPGALKDWFWGIERGKDGIYRFTVDPEALTVEVKRVSGLPGEFEPSEVTHLYMNGLATGSFDSNNPGAEMTALGNGVFEWTGELDYAAEDGDENHANKQFKFLTGIGDWNAVWYLIPVQAQADGYIEEAEVGKTYELQACSWIGGRSGIDAFFGVTPGTKGEFKVTVDVPAMQMTLSDPNGIDTVRAESDKVLGYYTVDGRQVSAAGLGTGIYIVRTLSGVRKIARN